MSEGTQTKPISKVGQGLIRLKVVEILSERAPLAFRSHYFWCCGGQDFSVNEILKCQINRKMLFDKSEERIRMIQSERAGSTYISAFIIPVHTLFPPNAIRRGIRSVVQLGCTETWFQKYSQSGKNGSKHPMLSISMAYNVISCKKVERNTQKLKIADFTM